MRIVDSCWTPTVNKLEIECHVCGQRSWHRCDRWKVRCGFCDTMEDLGVIRDRYVEENQDPHVRVR